MLYSNSSGKEVFYFNFKKISTILGAINLTKSDMKWPAGLIEYKFSLISFVVHLSNVFNYVNSYLQRRALLTYIVWRGEGDVQWNLNCHIWYTVQSLTSNSPWQKETIYNIITSVKSLTYNSQTKGSFETKMMTSPISFICWGVSLV